MILYGSPGACSQASHIALLEADLPFTFVKVGRDKQTTDGRSFKAINPKGYTPALELNDGTILTESIAILSYIAETSGKLLSKNGLERWRALEATEFMTTEVHGSFRPFFNPETTDAQKQKLSQLLSGRFDTLDDLLGDKTYLFGDHLTIADAYLFVMLAWAAMMGITVTSRLGAYAARMKTLPSVTSALAAEGLN